MNEQCRGLSCKWLLLAFLAELALIVLGMWLYKTCPNINAWVGVAFFGIFVGGTCMILCVALKCKSDGLRAYYDYCKTRMVAHEQEYRFSISLIDLVKTHVSRCHGKDNDDLVHEVILITGKINKENETKKGCIE